MTLLTAGFFPNTYFAENYYNPLYWPAAIGAVDIPAPESARQIIAGGVSYVKPKFPLQLGVTLDGNLVWVYPIPLKKED